MAAVIFMAASVNRIKTYLSLRGEILWDR